MGNCTKPNFMAIHRSTSRAETAMTQKEEEIRIVDINEVNVANQFLITAKQQTKRIPNMKYGCYKLQKTKLKQSENTSE